MRNSNMKRNMNLAVMKQKCPYCPSQRIWAGKLNVKAKCTKCKREIKHKIILKENKHKKMVHVLQVI